MMQLHNIIVHNIIKDIDSVPEVIKADHVLPINATTLDFTEQIKDIYYSRNPNYGIFDTNTDNYPFQLLLSDYLNNQLEFLEFTDRSVDILANKISGKRATGGYVVFSHFSLPSKGDFFAVFMLHNTKRYNVNNELEIKELMSLDIDKMDIGNFVNISKWNTSELTYLSFLRGRKEVRQYFTEFIGCTDQTTSKETSTKLKNALTDFCKIKQYSDEESQRIRNEVFSYCETQRKNNDDVYLDSLSAIIYPDDPLEFKNFACSEDYQVSAVFKTDPSIIKQIRYIKYQSKNFKIEFEQSMLRSSIIYDENLNELLIKNIPDDLRKELLR